MEKDTIRANSGQGSAQQAEVLIDMCYRFVQPLFRCSALPFAPGFEQTLARFQASFPL
jgi:hypothetical protein